MSTNTKEAVLVGAFVVRVLGGWYVRGEHSDGSLRCISQKYKYRIDAIQRCEEIMREIANEEAVAKSGSLESVRPHLKALMEAMERSQVLVWNGSVLVEIEREKANEAVERFLRMSGISTVTTVWDSKDFRAVREALAEDG